MLIYRTTVLPVVFYVCATLSVTLTEEHRLRVFENRVLRKRIEPKRDEVTGGWRKLHNLQIHVRIVRVIKSGRMRWEGNVAGIVRR
jgi:hypothetical protein